ncbi:vesicle transport protein USE1-like isoform X1 [Clavelina lepadiformis]|uniref:vesicle transport protein USE1-like isoform X1 n=1 Tax=Clavelina lepadiformis TaxID=159417 RepID=UPI004041E23E
MPPVNVGRVSMSRNEINLIRLLARCEEMAAKNEDDDWRLEKYVETLEQLLQETSKQGNRQPNDETLKEYNKKINFLKEFLATKKLPSIAEKALANQLLIPSKSQTISSVVASPTGQHIKHVAATKYSSEMRKELMSKESDKQGNLRQRSAPTKSHNTDEMLRIQQDQHERIAEDMISIARNLKHNITVSGKIIRDDTKVLHKASKKAEENISQLKHESTRLESHLHKGTNWWLWIALAVVCITFLFMIFFIRFVPKPR